MSSSDGRALTRRRTTASFWSWLPPEHGFWVMLSASLLTALIQGRAQGRVILATAGTLVVAAALGGLIHRRVRGNGNAQLTSAAALSVAGVPIAFVGSVDPRRIAVTVIAWAAVFLSSALIVRSTFARARAVSRVAPAWLDAAAVGLSAMACGVFAALAARGAALATGLAAVAALALVASRPTVKQLKRVGLALAALSAIAAVLLAL